MRFADYRKMTYSTIGCLFLFLSFLSGQTYRFKNYGAESKLPNTFIYTIVQDNNGFLWIGTANGLVKFNGFNFYNVPFPDSVDNRYASVSLKDKNGVLWFGCSDGSVFYARDNDLVKVQNLNTQSINYLFESDDGFIFIIPQDQMILKVDETKPDEITRLYLSGNIMMTTACQVSTDKLLLGTQENLLFCHITKDSVIVESIVEGIEYSKVQAIYTSDRQSRFLIGTEGDGLYKLLITNNKPVISRFTNHPELESLDIKAVYEDSEKDLWISTYGSGIFQLELSENRELIESVHSYNVSSGLPGENVKVVFQDIEGNIWIGFYGDGLSMLTSYAFSFYALGNNPEANNIIFISQVNNKNILGTPKGYYLFDITKGKSESFVDLSQRLGEYEISSFFHDNENNLWIATNGGGVFLKNLYGQIAPFYRSGNSGEDKVMHIDSDGEHLWLATINGVVVLDKRTGAVRKRYKIEDHLPHNSINQVFIKKNGKALVASECDRLYSVDFETGVTPDINIMPGSSRNEIQRFTESSNGVIWAATSGNGVFYFMNDSVFNINTSNGLLTNYCYSILADSDNKVWIGHERGFSRYDVKTGTIKTFTTDFANGGDCNPDALYESSDNKVLIGTSEGLIVYDRSRDKKSRVAPFNNIISVTLNDVSYPVQHSYVLPYNKYVLKVEYVGIDLSNPEKVYYSTMLNGWDNGWTEMKLDRQTSYPLRDGRYKFNLISVNEDGLTQESPIFFDIIVKKPIWRSWWFILLGIAASAGIVALIIRQREKAQKKIKDYLESELAHRTSIVIKQKEEIESQNIEITDSINYAKRIQSSILPDVHKLKETFKDAFIIFHPRDIVSGDFYWFDKLSDEKFIIVCADSTGHGVPGAFMSMIGSTLLQDIVSRKGITKPSQVLTMLDKQIFSTLNQNIDVGVSNDGMDMVVCEFNTKTRHVRFASAMRPVIIVLGGEPFYVKGNRCSVGGESVIEKYYDDQEYYMNEGDIIYMFSDGLPDQFGGSDGKKMKIARLKRLIEKVCSLPMNKQKEEISSFFFEWKGDYEQVDDILLMGVKV